MGKALEEALQKINKSYGQEIVTMGFDAEKAYDSIKRIPFSSSRANYMTYGGIPLGRIIEFAGEESSGKTTTALDIVGNAQEYFRKEYESSLEKFGDPESLGKVQKKDYEEIKNRGPRQVVYMDAENTLDIEWAELLGVRVEDMYIYKPQRQSAEEIFEDAIRMINTGEVGLLIIDSLGSLLSGQAFEKSLEERTYGGISIPLTGFSKKAALACNEYNCTVIGINQIRDNLNSMYGGVVTPGGRGWKHACSLRIMFKKGSYIDDNCDDIKKSSESPAGNKILMDIQKTKCFRPDRRTGFYTLSYTEGIESLNDLLELAVSSDVIHKGGAGWYTINDPKTMEPLLDDEGNMYKVQGKKGVLDLLETTGEVYERIYTYVNDWIHQV